MKKIFTLMIALIAITSVFAQSGRYDGNDGGNRYNKNYSQAYDRHDNSYNNRDEAYNGYGNHDYNRNSSYDREYDHGYGNNYSVYDNRDDRNRRDYGSYDRRNAQKSRTLKTVGAGLIVGGIIAILASH